MFKNQLCRVAANWRMPRRDLDKDIDALPIARRCWHPGEWYFGTSAPTTERVKVSGPCAEICLLRQVSIPYPSLITHRKELSQQNHPAIKGLTVRPEFDALENNHDVFPFNSPILSASRLGSRIVDVRGFMGRGNGAP